MDNGYQVVIEVAGRWYYGTAYYNLVDAEEQMRIAEYSDLGDCGIWIEPCIMRNGA